MNILESIENSDMVYMMYEFEQIWSICKLIMDLHHFDHNSLDFLQAAWRRSHIACPVCLIWTFAFWLFFPWLDLSNLKFLLVVTFFSITFDLTVASSSPPLHLLVVVAKAFFQSVSSSCASTKPWFPHWDSSDPSWSVHDCSHAPRPPSCCCPHPPRRPATSSSSSPPPTPPAAPQSCPPPASIATF